MTKLGFLALLLAAGAAVADPGMKLLKEGEWQTTCKSMNREKGKFQKFSILPFRSLKTIYSIKGNEIVQKAISYKDENCKNIHDAQRSLFSCEFTANDDFARCKQVNRESSKDGKNWKSLAMVDFSGRPDPVSMQAKIESITPQKMKLTTTSMNGKTHTETLSR